MKERQRTRWERNRAGGKWRFVLQYGVLSWGLTCWTISQLVAFVWGYLDHSLVWVNFWHEALSALILWPLAGIWWGIWAWNSSEKQYHSR